MVCESPSVVNNSFRPDNDNQSCKYPKGGYLIYPHGVLKEFGTLTQTISALWAMESGRSPVWNPAPLAQVGCLPAKTLKKHLPKLIAANVVDVSRSGRSIDYRLTRDKHPAIVYYKWAGKGTQYVKVPRIWHHYWPDLGFVDLLLLGFYRFASGRGVFARERACRMSYADLTDVLGFSGMTWRRAAEALERKGLIVRSHASGRAVSVRLPDACAGSDLDPVHFGPHPVHFGPVGA